MRKNFTPEQMLHTLRQAESGTPVAEACRMLGITEQTYPNPDGSLADGRAISQENSAREICDDKTSVIHSGRRRRCA